MNTFSYQSKEEFRAAFTTYAVATMRTHALAFGMLSLAMLVLVLPLPSPLDTTTRTVGLLMLIASTISFFKNYMTSMSGRELATVAPFLVLSPVGQAYTDLVLAISQDEKVDIEMRRQAIRDATAKMTHSSPNSPEAQVILAEEFRAMAATVRRSQADSRPLDLK